MIIDYKTFPSGKQYVCLREGKQSIFLRNILFIRHTSNPKEIVVVREWGSKSNQGVWEPPKGQMEWKEFADSGVRKGTDITKEKLIRFMREGVLREVREEAKIMPEELRNLRMLPHAYSESFPEAGPNALFRYQFWEASLNDLRPARKRIHDLVSNKDWTAILPADVKEKDDVSWWSPSVGWSWIRGAFSGKMTRMWYSLQD